MSFFFTNFAAKLRKIFDIRKFFIKKMTNIFVFYTEVLKCNPQRAIFRQQVIEATGWAYPTFYYKLHHLNLSPAELAVVNPIIANFQIS